MELQGRVLKKQDSLTVSSAGTACGPGHVNLNLAAGAPIALTVLR